MNRKKRIKYMCLMLIIGILIILGGCSKKSDDVQGESKISGNKVETKEKVKSEKGISDKNPIVTIEMEDGAKIKVELYPDVAPNTVRNFISLVQKGFYNGLIFHRVIPDFMIQGGDPEGTGMGGPGYTIAGEFKGNKFQNDLKHQRGVISMARSESNNSAGSQFFIMVKEAPHLDGYYAAFGKVIEGMEEVDKIVNTKTGGNDKPVQAQKMKSVTVDTFGVKYREVEKFK